MSKLKKRKDNWIYFYSNNLFNFLCDNKVGGIFNAKFVCILNKKSVFSIFLSIESNYERTFCYYIFVIVSVCVCIDIWGIYLLCNVYFLLTVQNHYQTSSIINNEI